MSALRDHIKMQAEKATFLSRIIDTLNVAIDRPDGRSFCIHLIEEAQSVASDLEDQLQDVHLPKEASHAAA